MGESYMNIFPADPLRPKPDWQRLRSGLLECGFLRDPVLRKVEFSVAHHLWERIVADRGRANERAPDDIGGIDMVVDALKRIELVPRQFVLDDRMLTIPGLIAVMKRDGNLSPGFEFPEQEGFSPGPLYWKLSSMSEPSDVAQWGMEICYEDFGENIYVACGEGLFAPPGIPGTDRVCAEWQELLDRWYRDPTQKWIDPETGKGYGILDLDWDNTLGAGRCWLEIHTPGYLDGNRGAALLSELSGQEFRYSWHHL